MKGEREEIFDDGYMMENQAFPFSIHSSNLFRGREAEEVSLKSSKVRRKMREGRKNYFPSIHRL